MSTPAITAMRRALLAIGARFRSGNDVPVEKALVPRDEWEALCGALDAVPQPPATSMIEALKAAVEGECDGLAISDKQARAILAHVLRDLPPATADVARLVKAEHPQQSAWRQGDDIPEEVLAAVAEALGDAYDCTRHWGAWNYGTMGPDDFSRVADDGDRVAEIAGAALEAAHAVLATPPEQAAQPADVVAVESGAASEPNWDYVRYTAEHVTGMPVERHSYSIIVREVRRWLADRQPQIDVARLA